jgi:hypothetical protein
MTEAARLLLFSLHLGTARHRLRAALARLEDMPADAARLLLTTRDDLAGLAQDVTHTAEARAWIVVR